MASKESAAARNRRITAMNKAFDKLSPAEKRVTLARDVIAQLEAGKLIADHVYVFAHGRGGLFGKLKMVTAGKDGGGSTIHKVEPTQSVEIKQDKCRVCGIGSLFVCGVKRADRLFGKDLEITTDYECTSNPVSVERDDNVKYLKRFFTEKQLDLIEEVYENSGLLEWEEVEDDTERMTLIMQNIVVNKGTFKPEKSPPERKFTMPGYVG